MRIWRTQVLSFFFLSLSLSEIRTFDDDSCTCWGDPNTSSKGCYWTVWYFDNNHQKYKFCSCERQPSVVRLHREANWEVVAPTYESLLSWKDQKTCARTLKQINQQTLHIPKSYSYQSLKWVTRSQLKWKEEEEEAFRSWILLFSRIFSCSVFVYCERDKNDEEKRMCTLRRLPIDFEIRQTLLLNVLQEEHPSLPRHSTSLCLSHSLKPSNKRNVRGCEINELLKMKSRRLGSNGSVKENIPKSNLCSKGLQFSVPLYPPQTYIAFP